MRFSSPRTLQGHLSYYCSKKRSEHIVSPRPRSRRSSESQGSLSMQTGQRPSVCSLYRSGHQGSLFRAVCPCKQVRSQRPSDFTELSTNLGSLSTQTGRQFVVFTDLTTRAVCPCEQVRGRLFLQSCQPRQVVHANRQSACSLYRSDH